MVHLFKLVMNGRREYLACSSTNYIHAAEAAEDDANEGRMRRHVHLGVLVMYVYESSEACFIQIYTMNNLHSFKFHKVNEAK